MNSFHAMANVKMTDVTRPGFAMGSEIFTNACHQLQPSIIAASSNSAIELLKKPIRISMDSESVLTT